MYHLKSVIVHKTLNTTPIASVISSPLQPIPFSYGTACLCYTLV